MKHTINLSQTTKDGIFPCPKCGNLISPDVEDENMYEIVETKVDVEKDKLESITLKCGKCKSEIELVMDK